MLVDTVKTLMPPEDVVSVTSLSDQALNYLPEGGLLNKLLILSEAVHNETVEHQIREMLSAHELSRMVTLKDDKTGKLVSRNVRTRAVVSAMMSSTSYKVNPENASRCFLMNADESKDQTRLIHKSQKSKYSLKRFKQKQHTIPQIMKKHTCAQRLLKNILIINPLGEYFDFPDTLMRTRRDHDRFVDLIAAVCFVRQYQKEVKYTTDKVTGQSVEYIECDLEDYRIAYQITVKGVLPSTLIDLPKSLVRFHEEVCRMVRAKAKQNSLDFCDVTFSQREIREYIDWLGKESIKRYLRMLLSYEYITVSKGGRSGQTNTYRFVSQERLDNLELSIIPTVEQLDEKMKKAESG
jgi:hypothetical protein